MDLDAVLANEYRLRKGKLAHPNYDLTAKQEVLYGHVQKTNLFHRPPVSVEQAEFTIE